MIGASIIHRNAGHLIVLARGSNMKNVALARKRDEMPEQGVPACHIQRSYSPSGYCHPHPTRVRCGKSRASTYG